MAAAQTEAPETGADETKTEPTAGSTDLANAKASPVKNQVTQAAPTVKAEGARLAEEAENATPEVTARPETTTIAESLSYSGIDYNDEGHLVNGDGKKIALASDATDLDVGWTAQHRLRDEPIHYPAGASPASVPDQTFHPDELPDPQAALRAGLLPQNLGTLNIDPKKFEGKKSLEA